MKFSATLFCALVAGTAASKESEFASYMVEFSKHYETEADYASAFAAWQTHDETIANHPANSSFKLAHNSYSDQTWESFRSTMRLGEPMPDHHKTGLRQRTKGAVHTCEGKCAEALADSVDWTAQGAVTEVKDQGQCGSCWSFSTTGSLEGAYFLAGNDLTEFSEQQLVDCDHNGDMGCNGGLMDNAFGWIEQNGGLCTEGDYPYAAVAGTCTTTCTIVADSAPASFTDVKHHSGTSLMSAIAQQPVSIAIEADQPAFQLYSSGVMDGTCGSQLDHGVLVVGYGTDETTGEDFWKIKNSWSDTWGEAGYIRIGRGREYGINGECGILDAASYPNMS